MKYFTFFTKMADFFRPKRGDDRPLLEKLRDKYHLVVQNEDTFEQIASVKLSPLAVYTAVSSMIVGTAIIVTLLIIWTPLKRYIPGYGDFTRDSEIAALKSKVKDLTVKADADSASYRNLLRILNGDLADISKAATVKQGIPENPADTLPTEVDRIPEDDALRAAVAKGAILPSSMGEVVAGLPAGAPVREKRLEQLYFIPPVSGEITAAFEPGKEHFGIDVAAPKNTAVKAAADGVVISAGYTVETGYSIAVQHPNNVVTMYKHNSVLLKKAGLPVKAGEALAIVGNTGEQSTGPHLHFELWYKGRAVDASDYINFK